MYPNFWYPLKFPINHTLTLFPLQLIMKQSSSASPKISSQRDKRRSLLITRFLWLQAFREKCTVSFFSSPSNRLFLPVFFLACPDFLPSPHPVCFSQQIQGGRWSDYKRIFSEAARFISFRKLHFALSLTLCSLCLSLKTAHRGAVTDYLAEVERNEMRAGWTCLRTRDKNQRISH